ncbi:protease [Thioclava sp. F42-5]|uniref:type 1 glutamine amidotransferase domain-containing protein n=1 Tax=unclassified Thioclava TaxID=2621713 RepID=UPI000B53A1A9|nr:MULTISPECIES: type 1 glutamine amidotransferase domain-containing protein [unclassified Thioclava]OWY03493.1 protease [Thioclava sp. F1Mire-8]OWY09457.1 protease [Thioclava sp. F42-5]PWE51919.1 type 1 glutamine amidotransferase [Thioclava sp. NG1]
MPKITEARILIMATDGFEQAELTVPRDKLIEAGAQIDIASLDGEDICGWDETDWGETVSVQRKISDVDASNYDAIVLPGGQINPDLLRVEKSALDLLRNFYDQGKVVAAVCHAPWLLIETGIAKGRKMTSYHSVRTDVENAGGEWVNESVVSDNGVVTSRNPKDLDDFVAKIIEEVQEGRHMRDAA